MKQLHRTIVPCALEPPSGRHLMNRLPALLALVSLTVFVVPSGLMAQGSVQAPVNLGTAGNYVILSQSGITDVPPSPIVGNIGASPITGAAIHVTCSEVTGTISSVDAAGPAPCSLIVPGALGVAINDMNTAYTSAAGRPTPDFINLGAGNVTGLNLVPGLYKWGTDVLIGAAGVTLTGGPNAVWIFQIAGDLTLANSAHIMLAGGASPNNIFWQVGASNFGATLGTGSVMYGTILSSKQVIENTGATLVGRALAQTQVTLQSTSVTTPGPLVGGIPVPLSPMVTSTVPANLSTNVPIGNQVSATFSEAMSASTLNTTTFTLKNGATSISGSVAYIGVTAMFTPTIKLPANTLLTGTITTGAQDPTGASLASNYVWTFTTGAGPNLTPPTVSSTVPASNALNVPVGNALSATFSEALNPLTVNTTTFTLKQGVTTVTGTVNYSGVTATFTPSGNLAPNVPFTATITTGVQDLSGNAMAANYVWTFTTGPAQSLTPPTVSSTVPASGATNVPVGNALSATFSEALNPLTVNTTTFTLKQGATSIAGTVNYAGITATFTASANLAPNLPYTATITTGVQDLSGNALAANYVWTFTTGAVSNVTPPVVISTAPASGASGVPLTNNLAATFSEAVNPLTVNTATFTLSLGGVPVSGTVSYSGVTAIFVPAATLAANATYLATLTTGVTDLSGNAMAANYTWNFTTALTVPVSVVPTVTSTMPATGATAVTVSTNVVANFNEPMNPLTISTSTFLLQQGTTTVPGAVTYANNSATFRPLVNLSPNTKYTAGIASSVADLLGNTLGTSYIWTFTTGAAGDQIPVCLANFAALSGDAINNLGATVVTGDVGVPIGGSITGFPPGTINGNTFTGNNVNVVQAMSAVTAAFADAAGRSTGPVAVTGEMGGQTLTSGLYRSASSIQILAGDLTLDAKGDVNSVFIFQMISSLNVGTSRRIILAGGAQAFNVFWQVGSSATIGPNSVFNGSILAYQGIAVDSGAVVNGRLAAITGSIFLQSSVVTSPAPFIALNAVFNSASYATTVAAGSIASVFGNNFGSSTIAATAYPLLPSLGETSFQVGAQAGPMFMTSCGQANIQIPWEAAGQTQVAVTATVAGLTSPPQSANIVAFSPAIFTMNQTGSGQGMVEVASTGQLAAPQSTIGTPVARGQYIAIYATGLGPVSNQPATGAAASSNPLSYTPTLPVVTIGGVGAMVSYSGLAPGFAGLYQINALVPASVSPGSAVTLLMTMGGVPSNTVTIAVQ
jgi:uncharacterized protein (TIGR03437 family)